ncbi:MAG: hypothetical protein ACMXX9_00260 [Candidatus Woesearchaeota archaeon]
MKDILKEYINFWGNPTRAIYFKNEKDEDIKEAFQEVLALNPGEEFNEHLNESDLVIMLNEDYKSFNGNLQGIKILTNNHDLFNDYKNYQFLCAISYENNKAIASQIRFKVKDNEFYVLKKR